MPYFREGTDLYWWEPQARERRVVGPGERVSPVGAPRAGRRERVEGAEEPAADRHGVRDTVVRPFETP